MTNWAWLTRLSGLIVLTKHGDYLITFFFFLSDKCQVISLRDVDRGSKISDIIFAGDGEGKIVLGFDSGVVCLVEIDVSSGTERENEVFLKGNFQ